MLSVRKQKFVALLVVVTLLPLGVSTRREHVPAPSPALSRSLADDPIPDDAFNLLKYILNPWNMAALIPLMYGAHHVNGFIRTFYGTNRRVIQKEYATVLKLIATAKHDWKEAQREMEGHFQKIQTLKTEIAEMEKQMRKLHRELPTKYPGQKDSPEDATKRAEYHDLGTKKREKEMKLSRVSTAMEQNPTVMFRIYTHHADFMALNGELAVHLAETLPTKYQEQYRGFPKRQHPPWKFPENAEWQANWLALTNEWLHSSEGHEFLNSGKGKEWLATFENIRDRMKAQAAAIETLSVAYAAGKNTQLNLTNGDRMTEVHQFSTTDYSQPIQFYSRENHNREVPLQYAEIPKHALFNCERAVEELGTAHANVAKGRPLNLREQRYEHIRGTLIAGTLVAGYAGTYYWATGRDPIQAKQEAIHNSQVASDAKKDVVGQWQYELEKPLPHSKEAANLRPTEVNRLNDYLDDLTDVFTAYGTQIEADLKKQLPASVTTAESDKHESEFDRRMKKLRSRAELRNALSAASLEEFASRGESFANIERVIPKLYTQDPIEHENHLYDPLLVIFKRTLRDIVGPKNFHAIDVEAFEADYFRKMADEAMEKLRRHGQKPVNGVPQLPGINPPQVNEGAQLLIPTGALQTPTQLPPQDGVTTTTVTTQLAASKSPVIAATVDTSSMNPDPTAPAAGALLGTGMGSSTPP